MIFLLKDRGGKGGKYGLVLGLIGSSRRHGDLPLAGCLHCRRWPLATPRDQTLAPYSRGPLLAPDLGSCFLSPGPKISPPSPRGTGYNP
jgi:hypothetical protein